MPPDSRERNEALFREVNEQIEDVSKTVPPDEQLMEFLCECDNRDCVEKIRLALVATSSATQVKNARP